MERKTLLGRSHGNCAQEVFGFHVRDQSKSWAIKIHKQRVPSWMYQAYIITLHTSNSTNIYYDCLCSCICFMCRTYCVRRDR